MQNGTNGYSEHRRLSEKVALVTGGSQGIGKSVAKALVSVGARVVFTYSRNEEAAKETLQELGTENAVAIRSDAGSVTDIEALVDDVVTRFGKIDILIANAALSPAQVSKPALFAMDIH